MLIRFFTRSLAVSQCIAMCVCRILVWFGECFCCWCWWWWLIFFSFICFSFGRDLPYFADSLDCPRSCVFVWVFLGPLPFFLLFSFERVDDRGMWTIFVNVKMIVWTCYVQLNIYKRRQTHDDDIQTHTGPWITSSHNQKYMKKKTYSKLRKW